MKRPWRKLTIVVVVVLAALVVVQIAAEGLQEFSMLSHRPPADFSVPGLRGSKF